MTSQDLLTIAILLSVALAALLFPGGPGTPKRLRLLDLKTPTIEP